MSKYTNILRHYTNCVEYSLSRVLLHETYELNSHTILWINMRIKDNLNERMNGLNLKHKIFILNVLEATDK